MSQDHQDALTEIAQLCRDEQWQLATWDIEAGLSVPGQTESEAASSETLNELVALNRLR